MSWVELYNEGRYEALSWELRHSFDEETPPAESRERDRLLVELCAAGASHPWEAWQAAERVVEGPEPDSAAVAFAIVARRLWELGARESARGLARRLREDFPEHPAARLLDEQLAAGTARGDDTATWEREQALGEGRREAVRQELELIARADGRALSVRDHARLVGLHLLERDFGAAGISCGRALEAWPSADGSDALRLQGALSTFAEGRAEPAIEQLRALRDRPEADPGRCQ